MIDAELYADEFKVSREKGAFWIHWAPFSYVWGTVTGPFKSHGRAWTFALERMWEEGKV